MLKLKFKEFYDLSYSEAQYCAERQKERLDFDEIEIVKMEDQEADRQYAVLCCEVVR